MVYPEISKIARMAIIMVVVVGSIALVGWGIFRSQNRVSDFAGYYTASKIVFSHDSVEHMYDDRWFTGRLQAFGLADTSMILYVNPPCVTLVMLPIVSLHPSTAKLAWNIFTLTLLPVLWLLGRNAFDIPNKWEYTAWFIGMIVISVPFLRNLQRGQLYILMLLLTLLLFRGVSKRNVWLTAMALATLLLLKYFGWLFLLFLGVTHRWKDLLITLSLVTIMTTIMILGFGIELYEFHFRRLFSSFVEFDVAITHLPSLPAFLGGLFVYHPLYNPSPVFDAPPLALILTLAMLIGMVVLSLRLVKHTPGDDNSRPFFALIVLSVVFTPLAAEHHYVVLAPAFWYLLYSGRIRFTAASIVLCTGLAYSLFGWFPSSGELSSSWQSQLYLYPHLFGALLLWALLITTTLPSAIGSNSNK